MIFVQIMYKNEKIFIVSVDFKDHSQYNNIVWDFMRRYQSSKNRKKLYPFTDQERVDGSLWQQ